MPKTELFYIMNLGCAKNLVDSNVVSQILRVNGYVQSEDISAATYILVNTCSFIKDARRESLQALRKLIRRKRKDQLVIAIGCLAERYRATLLKQIPGIDGMIGTRNLGDIMGLFRALSSGEPRPVMLFSDNKLLELCQAASYTAVQGNSSYLKIADGCQRQCAFCAIPSFKGSLRSRECSEVIADAIRLQAKGVQEINLIAQDLTAYGHDLGNKDGLAQLLHKLLPNIPDVPWLRLLYTYPGLFTPALLKLMQTEKQILPYVDMPLQHADPQVLHAMQRPVNTQAIVELFAQMRATIPDLVLRSTFIVGFPNESEEAFRRLYDFIKSVELDHLGVFTYSPEEGTPAFIMGDPIPKKVKEERRAEIMKLQTEISARRMTSLVGSCQKMLVEGEDCAQEVVVGRIWRDAPEVDGLTIARGKSNGQKMLTVQITSASEHDCFADVIAD